jgi:deoxyribonuclease V
MERVGGVDVAYRGSRYWSALAVCAEGADPEITWESGLSSEPYRSTLFFLKEAPLISRLVYGRDMDLLFVNGHGTCHPFYFGLATVVGITHRIPTVGVARRLIRGEYLWRATGSARVHLIVQSGSVVGAAVRRSPTASPLFVSPGYGLTVAEAVLHYFKWIRKGKIPEPLRLAHLHSRRLMRAAIVP